MPDEICRPSTYSGCAGRTDGPAAVSPCGCGERFAFTFKVREIGRRESPELTEPVREAVDCQESLRLRKGKRSEQNAVYDGEHNRGRADAQRQDQRGDRCESGFSPERPHRVSRVLRKILQPARAAGIPALFFHLLGAADSEPGLAPRLRGIEAARDEIVGVPIQMKAQLFFELLLHPGPLKQTGPPVHRTAPSIARIRPTASLNRCQLAASASSCLRPFRVS